MEEPEIREVGAADEKVAIYDLNIAQSVQIVGGEAKEIRHARRGIMQ